MNELVASLGTDAHTVWFVLGATLSSSFPLVWPPNAVTETAAAQGPAFPPMSAADVAALHVVATRARGLVEAVLDGNTRFSEAELDALEALFDALKDVPDYGHD